MDRPVPVPSSLDREFWTAAKQGKLVLQQCVGTGKFQWYPRAYSLYVPKGAVAWVGSPGLGKVVSFSVVARSFYPDLPAPYALAVVELDEGIRMTGHIVDTDLGDIRIGMPTSTVFRPISDDISLPCFAARAA